MIQSGNTTTSQMSQQQLAARFLKRTAAEIDQMLACLPQLPAVIETAAAAHIERIAHKIASTAEPFGFPEISALAAAIEHIANETVALKLRARTENTARLRQQLAALEEYVEHATEEAVLAAQAQVEAALAMAVGT